MYQKYYNSKLSDLKFFKGKFLVIIFASLYAEALLKIIMRMTNLGDERGEEFVRILHNIHVIFTFHFFYNSTVWCRAANGSFSRDPLSGILCLVIFGHSDIRIVVRVLENFVSAHT